MVEGSLRERGALANLSSTLRRAQSTRDFDKLHFSVFYRF
jgi:hypothetical protein